MESDTVNQIKSVYPLDDIADRIRKNADAGNLVVTNKSKAEQMLATIGVQPAEVSRIINLAKTTLAQDSQNVNIQHSLSEPGKPIAPVGGWNIRGEDVMLGPVREDMKEGKAPFSAPIREDVKAKGTVPTGVNGIKLGPDRAEAAPVAEQTGKPAADVDATQEDIHPC